MRYILPFLVINLVIIASSTAVPAQVLIDFGTTSGQTTGAPRSWNNVHPGSMSGTTKLLDTTGFPTGIDLMFAAGKRFTNGNGAGTTSPTPNSPLAKLGYPISAVSDYLYGSTNSSLVEFTLQNLDMKAAYDFTICASRMNASDILTTEYTFQGSNGSSVTLDAANNTANIASVTGIVPDIYATITVRIRAAQSNTSPNGYFYLNAMGITKKGGGPPPPMLAFLPNQLTLSRVAGKPACLFQLVVAANASTTPGIRLAAIDNRTGNAPTWLSLPATATSGKPFHLGFGHSALAAGTYRATLTAEATGYRTAMAPVILTVRASGGPLNLLYYGNSFSMGNGTVPDLVQFIAQDMGLPAPNTIKRLAGGKNLLFHLTDPIHAAAITQALLPGEEWDYVILQGHSTEATRTLGNPAAFLANAKAILANVRAHSPAARAIMFQTWARAQGHAFYQGSYPSFSGPREMHQQIEASYIQAVVNLDQAFGKDSARRAAAGETAALFNFIPAIYAQDLYHAGPPITTMSAMAIFTAIYGKPVSGFVPDFNKATSLVQRLKSFGMVADDWRKYAGIADRVADPVLRHFPGSGEDLLLESSINGPLTAVPIKTVSTGKLFSIQLTSPIGTGNGIPGYIMMTWFPTGSPPSPPAGFPEVHIHPPRNLLIVATSSLGKLSWQVPVSATAPGWSLLFQGASLMPSARTGNPAFTTTDGHEIRMK